MVKTKKINWNKILSNALVSFCTSFLAVNMVGLDGKGILVALVTALLTAALASGQIWKQESEEAGSSLCSSKLLVF